MIEMVLCFDILLHKPNYSSIRYYIKWIPLYLLSFLPNADGRIVPNQFYIKTNIDLLLAVFPVIAFYLIASLSLCKNPHILSIEFPQ